MMNSDANRAIVVTGPDLLTEIHVFNSDYRLVELNENLGQASANVAVGKYFVRFQVGNSILDRTINVDTDVQDKPVDVTCSDPLDLFSPIPLPRARSGPSEQLSDLIEYIEQGPPESPRSGPALNEILLVVRSRESHRDEVEAAHVNYLHDVKLHQLDGDLIWSGASENVKCGGGWSASWLTVDGKSCRLRMSAGQHGFVERIIPVCPGWRTMLFFRCVEGQNSCYPDFGDCSIVLLPATQSAALSHPDCRLTEMAFAALIGNRAVLATQPSQELLTTNNPWLLLLFLNLYVRCKTPDSMVLATLVEKVLDRGAFPSDALAIAWKASKLATDDADPRWTNIRNRIQAASRLQEPPVLWFSWQILLDWSEEFVNLFQQGSLVDFVAPTFRAAGPWQVWWSTDNEQVSPISTTRTSPALPESDSEEALETAIHELALKVRKSDVVIRLFQQSERFSPVITRLGRLLNPLIDPLLRNSLQPASLLSRWFGFPQSPFTFIEKKIQERTPSAIELIHGLSLPPEILYRIIQDLLCELNRIDGASRLQHIASHRSLHAALLKCHMPCRNILSADDFAQTVLVRAIENWNSFKGRTDAELVGWLKGIGQKLQLAILRRAKLEKRSVLPPEIEDPRAGKGDQDLDMRAQADWLFHIFEALQPFERELLLRVVLGEEKIVDIAKTMEIHPNTLSKRYRRLLKHLRRGAKKQ